MFVRSLRSCKCTTAIALRSFARASPVAQHHVGSVRTFSIIGDTFTKMATNKMESDKGIKIGIIIYFELLLSVCVCWRLLIDKRFASMLETMLSGEKWSLRPWKKTLEDQLSSWLMYVPGMKDSSETKELNAYKGVRDATYECCSLLYLFTCGSCRYARRVY